MHYLDYLFPLLFKYIRDGTYNPMSYTPNSDYLAFDTLVLDQAKGIRLTVLHG